MYCPKEAYKHIGGGCKVKGWSAYGECCFGSTNLRSKCLRLTDDGAEVMYDNQPYVGSRTCWERRGNLPWVECTRHEGAHECSRCNALGTLCMYVYMHACMYVMCVCVCVYVYMYIYIHTYIYALCHGVFDVFLLSYNPIKAHWLEMLKSYKHNNVGTPNNLKLSYCKRGFRFYQNFGDLLAIVGMHGVGLVLASLNATILLWLPCYYIMGVFYIIGVLLRLTSI